MLFKFHPSVTPEPGDIVCAQVYNMQRGTAETLLRLYKPPYLLVHTTDRNSAMPLYIDNERVQVRGTMIRLIRERRT